MTAAARQLQPRSHKPGYPCALIHHEPQADPKLAE